MPRLSRQDSESGLCHVLRQMRVHDHAKCHGIDQRNVPAHQFSEGGFGTPFNVIAEQFAIGSLVHSPIVTRCPEKRTADLKGLRSASAFEVVAAIVSTKRSYHDSDFCYSSDRRSPVANRTH